MRLESQIRTLESKTQEIVQVRMKCMQLEQQLNEGGAAGGGGGASFRQQEVSLPGAILN